MDSDHAGCSSTTEEAGGVLGFEINTTPGSHDRFIIPDYDCKRKYKLVGDSVKEDEQLQPKKRRNTNNSCWNCGEFGHSNRKCTQPVNYSKMASNRQQFINSRSVRNGVQRYYADNEQKFDRFKPGLISKSLRKAMGLNRRQLPLHIYNMRRLGYPGGWMEEAKVSHSGITLFDCKGNIVADPDDEEGEVVDDIEQRSKYDINKLIKYPGFNVPPPPGTEDEAERFGMPPMMLEHSFQYLVDSLRPNEAKAYRRQKVPIIPSASPPRVTENSEDVSTTDMECEETPETGLLPEDGCGFVPPLPETPLPPPPPEEIPEPPLVEEGESLSSQSADGSQNSNPLIEPNRISPTLNELEEQKKSILVELDNADSSDSLKDKEIVSPLVSRVRKADGVTRTPSPNLGRMKSIDLGTPILKSVSPYSKLPSPESFSQNICDVINFENLPDSTGIYDKMVGIINKVRSAVKRFHQDAV